MIILHVTKTKNETLARFLIFPLLIFHLLWTKTGHKSFTLKFVYPPNYDYRCEMGKKKTTEEWKAKSIFNRFYKKMNLCGGQNLKDPDKHII